MMTLGFQNNKQLKAFLMRNILIFTILYLFIWFIRVFPILVLDLAELDELD